MVVQSCSANQEPERLNDLALNSDYNLKLSTPVGVSVNADHLIANAREARMNRPGDVHYVPALLGGGEGILALFRFLYV